jgi:NTE family protein
MPEFKNLVIAGGGVKGIACGSSLKAMNDLNKLKYIEKVCGTSVGSMIAVLVVCKCSNTEIDKYLDIFWNELTNFNKTIIKQVYNFHNKLGLYDNKSIYNVINQILFDKFKINNLTLKQFYDLTKIEYTAVTTNLTTRKANFMNYKTEPDLEVAKAVQMSTAIPVYFYQVKWHGMIFCDGAVCENFALEYYDDSKGRFNDETLGFHFIGIISDTNKIDTMLELIEGIEDSEITNNENQSIKNYDERFIIEINCENVNTLDFNITQIQKNMLLTNGYNAVIQFYSVNKTNNWIDYLFNWYKK